jgi:hypothetical protein
MYLDTVLMADSPYDNKPMEEFFHKLGYVTNYDTGFKSEVKSIIPNGKTDTSVTVTYEDDRIEELDGIIIGVNITNNDGELTNLKPTKGGKVVGHWVTLLEYNPDTGSAEIYNPFMNVEKRYEGGDLLIIGQSWWGSGLLVEK